MVEYYLTGDVDLSKHYLAKDYTKRPYKAISKGLYLYGQYYIDFIDLHLPKLLDINFSKYSKWYNNGDKWDKVIPLLRN